MTSLLSGLQKKIILVFIGVGLLCPYKGWADIFRYEDSSGVIHFTNIPTSTKFRLFLRENGKNQTSLTFKGYRKNRFSRASFHSLPALDNNILEAAQQYGVDPKLIQAVIHVESNFDHLAISPKGAQGLMQLMPQTARDLQVVDPFCPKENIVGGTKYLKYLLDLFNQDMTLALAAYNAGPEKVNIYRGVPPYSETKNYVQRVIQIYNRLKAQLGSSG
jgi:hypothetical protein